MTANIKQRIEQITELPPMPEMAQKVVHLHANPYAQVEDLAHLIETDPSLAAQIIRYARSPFFGYRGNISSVRDAISRVLGYDVVMNIALGIAAASPFKNPTDGPLGLNAFWRHAVYSAALTQSIGNALPKNHRPRSGIAYLAGLLHNFGFLLLGHLFKEEFAMLNRAVSASPDLSVLEHEERLLGVGHTEIGAWLMQAWNMPIEIIIALREHHNTDYRGEHACYANLVLIANHLLKSYDCSDGCGEDLPVALLQELGLHEHLLDGMVDKVLAGGEDLDTMARMLAA